MTSTKTLVYLLKNPISIKTKHQAKQLHAQIFKTETPNSPFFVSRLVSVYTNFNLLNDSLHLFNTLNSPPPALAWKSIIRCYTDNGLFVQSLLFFVKMMASGVHPDHNGFPSVLKSSTLSVDLRFGESVHACVVRLGFHLDFYTNNALMNMYAKFQSLDMSTRDEFFGLQVSGGHKIYVHEVLDGIPERNGDGQSKSVLVSCNEPNTDYRKHRFEESVLGSGDNVNLHSVELPCSDGARHVDEGSCAKTNNGRRLQMDSVRKVFEQMPTRDLVSWNTVIVGFARSGLFEEALKMVMEMRNANLKPDSFTLSSVLPIFAEYVDVIKGKEIHGYAIRHGLDTDLFIGSSLIDMYAKCTRVEDSHRLLGFHGTQLLQGLCRMACLMKD